MRRALGITVGVAALVALAIGGAWLWSIRPWRVVASVNGVALTARELDLRAAAYGGDRREMARTWIAKEVLLGEAVQRSVSVAEADERAAKDILAAWLANAGTTPERFFQDLEAKGRAGGAIACPAAVPPTTPIRRMKRACGLTRGK